MNLKNRGLLITTVIFFLTINTRYYWEGKLGHFAFPVFLILLVIYFILTITLVRQIYFAVKEKMADKPRLLLISILTFILVLTFIKPLGIINFNQFEDNAILISENEGAANCSIRLKLNDDFTFKERNVCFGITEISGKYHIKNDTIYFVDVELGIHENEFYKFAIIKASKFNKDRKHFELIRYKSFTDTVGHKLLITKNELNK